MLLDLRLDFGEHQPSPFHAQHVTSSMVHVLVPRLGVDGKQLSYLHQDPRRDEVLLIEFDRFVELPPGMRPACSVDHPRSADTVVSRIGVRLHPSDEDLSPGTPSVECLQSRPENASSSPQTQD